MTQKQNGRQRQPTEIRRRMLMDAARTVIVDRGLHATTVRDIAAAGEVAVGTVTYHFSGIAEVLAGVLEAEMQGYSAPVMRRAAAAATGRKGLGEIIEGLLGSQPRLTEHWKLWLDFWTLAAHRPEYSAYQSQIYQELHEQVRKIIVAGIADGSLSSADPADAAVAFVSMMDGLVIQAYVPQSRLTPKDARRLLHHFVDSSMEVAKS
ncbi:TetR family transcriptional regulator [Nakamurella antarctica]|uniref:TetR family transcriptional regulator n=1 Tax=Nakamurella antarctica TaxID=1902245 RepID=A0A3G8ZLW2_9ACTN|nr:TetR/AcrR family transcriptional regulator [Nakamurella antarctica]AZI58329.1 TetR family transcriptional regulator [Nakamurella antarctica]